MADDRMAVLETLRKAIAEGDVDFLREGVRVLAQAIMEAEVTELTGVPKGERDPGAPPDPPQRVPRAALGHPGGHDRARHPAGPRRLVLPVPARAPPAGRAGPARGRPGGVRRWASRTRRVDDLVRALGHRRHQQERGEPDLRRARRRGRGLPEPLARGRGVPVPLARRDVPQGPRGRAGWCRWRPSSRPAWPRAASGGSWGSSSPPGNDEGQRLAGVHPLARRARPARRPPGHQRRPRGAWSRPSASSSWARAGSAAGCTCTRNAQDLVPRSARSMVASAIRSVFEQPDEALGPGAVRPGHRQHPAALPGGRRAAGRRRARPARPLHVPRDPPPPDPQHQPARAAQQGDQAPDRGRRDLPQPGLGHPPGRDDPRRAGRRVAGRPALLPARDDGGSSTPSSTTRRWARRC